MNAEDHKEEINRLEGIRESYVILSDLYCLLMSVKENAFLGRVATLEDVIKKHTLHWRTRMFLELLELPKEFSKEFIFLQPTSKKSLFKSTIPIIQEQFLRNIINQLNKKL